MAAGIQHDRARGGFARPCEIGEPRRFGGAERCRRLGRDLATWRIGDLVICFAHGSQLIHQLTNSPIAQRYVNGSTSVDSGSTASITAYGYSPRPSRSQVLASTGSSISTPAT